MPVAPELKPLQDALLERTVEAPRDLWRAEPGGAVRCVACGHRCLIHEGRDGICKVRSNRQGTLRVPWGYVGGLQADPIEKKPFFHVLPGSQALSFGMLGCDFHCGYCQNWFTSQTLRDKSSTARPSDVSADELIAMALGNGVRTLTSTYNEPLITSEWAVEIFKKGRARGLHTSYVSNGNATPEVLGFVAPHLDFYKIDLKSFDDKHYRSLGGVLANVLRSIEQVFALGLWLEIVTLVIPGFNDDPKEIRALCRFLAGVSRDIPWHATAFHKDYRMRDPGNTTAEQLVRCGEIAKEEGLNFVYLGNLPGRVGGWENTYCPHCRAALVTRRGFHVLENRMRSGSCPDCAGKVAGRWT